MFGTGTSTLANLRDLIGFWSCFAFALGLSGAFASHRASTQAMASAPHEQTKIIEVLPAVMWLAAFFIGWLLPPLSMAYSGPALFDGPVVRSYDKFFGGLIALAFGLVFAFDRLRFPKLRRKPDTWVGLAVYLATALFLMSAGTTHCFE
jgi:hypothetical protein